MVAPLQPPARWNQEYLAAVLTHSQVPLWLPWPLPAGWVLTGVVLAGDPREPAVASAVMLSGPAALGGPAELVLVAEEPGVGLGAGYAGVSGPDPGPAGFELAPTTRVMASDHETSLWEVPTPVDRSAYLGEAVGCWLWAVSWPMESVLVLHDQASLVDLRDAGHPLDVPLGAPSPRWRPGGQEPR